MTAVDVYKSSRASWVTDLQRVYPYPSVLVGDFNSHDVNWKYNSNDLNGENVVRWGGRNDRFLIFDGKDRGSFRSVA